MIPEISDRIVEIDRAMRWGYGHKMGPFELWDALGFQNIACRMQKEGRVLPQSIQDALASGATSLYRCQGRAAPPASTSISPRRASRRSKRVPERWCCSDVKRSRGIIKKNGGASLVDVGDGVLCVEFHSKMNSIGEDIIDMLNAGLEETEKNFEAMIIANDGENFCVGANLVGILLAAQDGEWDELERAVSRFQQTNMALKCAAKPVISAPFARTLGGGCEIALHTIPQASAELYMGQVELGVGLIPGAGGCKELLLRLKDARKAFELVGFAKVSEQRRGGQEPGPARPRRADFDERRAAHRRCQATGAHHGAVITCRRRAAHRYQGARRERLCAVEAGRLVGPAGPLYQRPRCR